MRRVRFGVLVLAIGCGGGDDTDGGPVDDGQGGACGEVTEWDLHITGMVVQDGLPVEGADVQLEERAWSPGGATYGAGLTGPDGVFSFDAVGVVSVEDCWGTALDYVLVAVRGDDVAEDDVNSSLYGAITDGEAEVDLTSVPLEL